MDDIIKTSEIKTKIDTRTAAIIFFSSNNQAILYKKYKENNGLKNKINTLGQKAPSILKGVETVRYP
jgi:hypothetical protein